MLTLLYGYSGLRASTTLQGQDLRPWLCLKGYRKDHLFQIRWHLDLPPDSPLHNPYHEGHLEEMRRDAAKLLLLDLLDPYLLKRIMGLADRNTKEIKLRDPVVIRTLDQKLLVNVEIVKRAAQHVSKENHAPK